MRSNRNHPTRRPRGYRRAGLVLPTVLVILLFMGLLAASFAFNTAANHQASLAQAERFQCRLAAEAGIHRVMGLLRLGQNDISVWYNNQALFDQALVWAPDARPEDLGLVRVAEVADEQTPAFRFSIVADNIADDELEIRFGLSDEASKLNLNYATEAQLLALLRPMVPPEMDPQELVDTYMDWLDADDEPRLLGAENEYYQNLPVPRQCKNGPLETVEELLMIKGFTGQIVYGEDFDRNGLLTPNEDDADESFPPDDGDGTLNRGMYPYVTIYSYEFQTASDNKPRTNLFGDPNRVRERLEEAFDNARTVDFIIGATQQKGNDATRSLADYLKPRMIDDRLVDSPLRAEDVAILFDKFSLSAEPQRFGLININTAPPQVLRCIENLPAPAIPRIVQTRPSVTGPIRNTTAWLVTEGILTADEFGAVDEQITARSRQFTIESIGFADHLGLYSRLQVIVDMRGPLAQVVYYRDLSKLGLAYPVRGVEGARRLALRENDTRD